MAGPPRTAGGRARKPPSSRPTPKGARRIAAAELPAHAAELLRRLRELYPEAHCELDHRSAYELLVATILSAQTTDKRVNMVTPRLFKTYPTAATLAAARQEDVEEIIKSTGFFRNKAKSIIGMAGAVVDRHAGRVPGTMAELVTLPGVGRKTANVVLGNAFGIDEGIVVDTHVVRLSQRLGLTKHNDPVRIEQDLMRLFPRESWTLLAHLLIWHGRRICEAKKPRCEICPVASICPSARVTP
ncbi:MAG TPA: endonuclease III [Gemmatimonadaceae bacterium]|nr:endonuclease III [Gemmatimonadaceae bacterium]